ncbi:hypothetical protein [Streptomyces sp. NBC_00151]|uniref:hypothetical protein n=1 Tax=Streptomyces sp. NBC_00151 TaxID=2975669 RepID=UPI002DD87B8D|nr:hypothetical protein [Streptomyces sp. NBC_00151]WRZ41875.1 hypothetical protein OG915_29850 [Streptomyces sp. NBC_00151]
MTVIAVTTEQLEQAEQEAERAREALREAEREYAANRASQTAYGKHKDAVDVADHALVRARLLRQDWEVQEEARQRRVEAGEAAAQEMARDVEGLAASRTSAVAAVVAAAGAMRAALDALAEHDERVRVVGAKLAARGLRCTEGEPTGAGLDGSVWVRGQLWPLVDGGSVLGQLLADVVAGVQPRHPLARFAAPPYGGVTAGRGRDEVLALVRAERGR